MLEHDRVRLRSPRALSARVQATAKGRPLCFGAFQTRQQKVALATRLMEFGVQTTAAREMHKERTDKPGQPGH
jgi:hypothetical protein